MEKRWRKDAHDRVCPENQGARVLAIERHYPEHCGHGRQHSQRVLGQAEVPFRLQFIQGQCEAVKFAER